MAYLVLARKYRPARFADMIGQDHVTRTLANAIRGDRVHHAYLFCGVRGLGKTTAARILAKCLVCREGPTPEPCDQCDQCRAIAEGRSVDVIEIDGASNNSVDNIRALREQVYYLPQSARRKIYIIDEVHMLTAQAFNALLKTLEEPPPHVTFLFATTDPHKVLPTILSRVSRLDFRRVRAAELVPHLAGILAREAIECEREGLHVIARCSDGSVRDALTLLDKVIAFAADPVKITTAEILELLGETDRFAVAELAEAVLAGDGPRALELFQRICAAGGDLQRFALAFLQHLRDLYVVKLCGRADLVLEASDDLYELLRAQASGVDLVVLAQYFDRFTRVVDELDRSRVPRLVVEMGLLELAHAEPLTSIGALIERLESIERADLGAPRGGQGAPPAAGRRPVSPADRRPARSGGAAVRPPTAAPTPASHPRRAEDGVDDGPRGGDAGEFDAAHRSGAESGLVDRLWGMVRGDDASRVRGELSAGRAPPRAAATVTPTASSATPAEAEPRAPRPAADTPSRAPVDWRGLTPFAAWEGLLVRVRDQDELLFAVLTELGLARLDEQGIELAAPSTSFAGQRIRGQPELLEHLRRFVETAFAEPLPLRLIDASPSLPELPSLELVERERRRTLEESVTREVLDDPQIAALLHTFAARLGQVDPLVESTADGGRPRPAADPS